MSPVGAAWKDQLGEKGSLTFLLLPMGSKAWQREQHKHGWLAMLGLTEGV